MLAELDIPAPVQELLTKFRNEDNVKIDVREILRGGYSGAFVSLVNATVPFDGVFVLKVGERPHGYPDEIERHKAALAYGAFSHALPAIVSEKLSDSHYALLLKVAGGSSGSNLTLGTLVWQPR